MTEFIDNFCIVISFTHAVTMRAVWLHFVSVNEISKNNLKQEIDLLFFENESDSTFSKNKEYQTETKQTINILVAIC